MNLITAEWVTKAEGDWTTSLRERRARKNPNFDSSCFHAQQCVEKYLKACLQESGTIFDRTHNLVVLLDLLAPSDPAWEVLRAEFQTLTQFAIELRYPGQSADKKMAMEAISIARKARTKARLILALPP